MYTEGEHIPIYQRLTDFYTQRIYRQEYQPGARIDSINKIMDRHQVSRETAKMVIHKLIGQGLAVSVQGKGTFVNSLAETQKKWGVLIPFFSSNNEQLIAELRKEALKQQCELDYYLHYNNPEEEMRICGNLILSGYEGIIVVPNYDETKTAAYYKHVLTGKSKLILADNTMAGSFFNYVIQSYDLGVKRAFEYLSERHDGNFLLLGNDSWRGENLVFELMERTFRLLVQEDSCQRTLFVRSNFQDIDAEFIRGNDIRGIMTLQDTDAVRIIGRLKEWGIYLPGQVSLVSYGNTEITQFFNPRITSIDCNYPEMAAWIARFIQERKPKPKSQVVISPEIIIRET